MSRYIRLEIGGKERGLNFKMGVFGVIAEVTGDQNPFQFKAKSTSFPDVMEYLAVITFAALSNNCQVKKEDIDFTIADVREWVKDIDPDASTQIINAFVGNPKAAEVGSDTQ